MKRIVFVVLKMLIISGTALAQTIPLPDSEWSWKYLAVDSPKRDTVLSGAMPIGVGSVASGGNTVEIQISLGQFSGPVDIIFGIYAPAIGFDSINILKSDYTFQPLSMGVEPWKTNVVDINERLFGEIATSELPPGRYDLYLGVTPPGSIKSFYVWTTSFGDTPPECDSEPVIRTTEDGVQFVRTPDPCFKDLPDFPYETRYVEVDGLRQAYVDEGPADADPILLLHGQPSWSYLYRKMIPVLVAAGHRVIAMDHVGFGRSDKPIDIKYYSYLGHIDRLEKFIKALNLANITMFCHDWGSLIGLHVAGEHPYWFARIVVGDGTLPVMPAGSQPYFPVENPDEINYDIVPTFALIPPQQFAFFDEEGNRLIPGNPRAGFQQWMEYAMTAASFHPAEVLEAMTYFDLPSEEEAAYDAPFPSRIYMAGPRVFPSLVNDLPGKNDKAWAGLTRYYKPFLTIWASNDPGNLGSKETQEYLTNNIPGAADQPHTRLPEASHFLQDDQGAEIARRMVEFIAANPR